MTVVGQLAIPHVRGRAQAYPGVALPTMLGLAVLVGFAGVSLRHLDVVPPVYEDEPWQASTALKLAQTGVFGSDLFAGLAGMEQHYYGFMPLHPLLLAGFFKLLGEGLVQARLEAVSMAVLTLALTFALGWRLFGAWVGALALLLLSIVRWTGTTYVQPTGIAFLDLARIARYDVVVPVFGLAALHVYLWARCRGGRWYAVAGLLAGLSGLAHLYGLFWLVVLLVLIARDGAPGGRRRAAAGWVILGGILPWLPYVAYVLGDVSEWREQVRGYRNRFEIFDLGWYVQNVLNEPHRYGPGLGPFGPGWLLRPGFWTVLALVPLSLAALLWRGLREADRAARAVAVPGIVLPVLFGLLLRLKLVNYTLTLLPLLAIAAAWGIVTGLDWLMARPGGRLVVPLVAALAAGVLAEGASRVAGLEAAAATETPYASYIQQVRSALPPPGARVVGLHTYWFGLEDYDYRSWIVPLAWMDRSNQPRPIPLDAGLDRLAPDAVLIDARIRAYFDQTPAVATEIDDWLRRHGGRLAATVEDPTYGRMEVYRLGSERAHTGGTGSLADERRMPRWNPSSSAARDST